MTNTVHDGSGTWSARKAGVPADPGHPPTLPHLLRHVVGRHGDREFLVEAGRSLTYADAAAESAELALGLVALGMGKAARVGILMPNGSAWVVSWLAAGRAGGLTVPLSTLYQPREIAWALRHTDIEILLVQAEYLGHDYVDRLERAVPGLAEQLSTTLYLPEHPHLRHVVVWGDVERPWAIAGPESLRAAAGGKPALTSAFLAALEERVTPADDLLIVLTSGSSAEPKAVVHTHGAAVRTTSSFMDYLGVRRADRTYVGHPFFWIAGININLFAALHSGSCMVFSETPAAEEVLALIERERVTRVNLWPTQVGPLLARAAQSEYDLSSVRAGLGLPRDADGEPIPPRRLISGGLGGGLGMTETFGMHSIEKFDQVVPQGKDSTWGRPLPGVQRRVLDPHTGVEVAPGVQGEVYVRGYPLMRGYYGVEREATFTADGYFATGDLVTIDEDGFLYFHGRGSELIKTSGANVAPREVELVAQSFPEVGEAVVMGLPDEVRGEIVVCVVVPRAGYEVDPADLEKKLRGELSSYKVPHEYLIMSGEDVPRTGSAKANKPQLREVVAERLGR